MSIKRHHADWLSLVEVSGPFLSMPVLEKVFPQGLDAHDPDHFRNLRLAYEEWDETQNNGKPKPAIHNAWMNFVLRQTLELPEEVIVDGQAVPETLKATEALHGETLRPDIVVRNPDDVAKAGKPRLLIQTYPGQQNLEKAIPGRRWNASPATRMMELLHSTDVRLGIVTNGEHWMLVDAPRNETTGFASWYSSLWLEEQITLRAFRSLLGVRRFFGVDEKETLETMLAESAKHQNDVTDQLGMQVRDAVEVLIQSLDRADQDHGRELLAGVPETVLYEAALTVMMRLVFLFSAEERELLLLGDPLYDQHYAVSTLVAQLQEVADQYGEEVLERRHDAWCRLLSTFRAVYGGVQHDRLKIPAYGGNLFYPDRYCFLEGRTKDTAWRITPANPLPVNNRTVLHLLRSLQYLEMQGEARRLSFRALDIEQIGHVYESLLDHTAKRAIAPMLGLTGAKGKEPEVPLADLESAKAKGEDDLVKLLKDTTKRSESALRRALSSSVEGEEANKLRAACGNDDALFQRVRPFGLLLRTDTFDRPVVVRQGSVFVTAGTDRRSSGTHYTPRSLTEPIVQYTLEPLVYVGPAEGKPQAEWELRPAGELLDLNICDMACGSGAFLVQACRYLSELLVEAWKDAEKEHPDVPGITPEGIASSGLPGEQLIPKDTDEKLAYARRLVALRCLYGVDKNPLAAEMAKLSLWLLTLAKDKPFTFLDHAIRCGDSLIGIHDLKQLKNLSMEGDPKAAPAFLQSLQSSIREAAQLRTKLSEHPGDTAEQVRTKEGLFRQAQFLTAKLRAAADLLIADYLNNVQHGIIVVMAKFRDSSPEELQAEAQKCLKGRPTFHWSLEFPEVMLDRGGFDAFMCNPPFMGGQKITGNLGTPYRNYLVEHLADGKRGSADLCSYFFLRAAKLLRQSGQLGFLATNTIAQGDTREVGLDQLTNDGYLIPRAISSQRWPGTASLEVAHVWLRRGNWNGTYHLENKPVSGITAFLTPPGAITGNPHRLAANAGKSFQGSIVLGMGFVLTPEDAQALIDKDPRNKDVLFPYLNGEDLNSRADQSASRWVINFFDWPLDRETAPEDYTGPVAADYPDCLAIVEEKVKPERLQNNDKGAKEFWWRFLRPRPELYRTIARMERVLVTAAISPTSAFCFLPANIVFAHKLIVFAIRGDLLFCAVQSSIHREWSYRYSSTLGKTTLNYSPSDCFETFPFPGESDFSTV